MDKAARRLQYVTGHGKNGRLPADLDWRSLADPATTTAIYMPARTLQALVTKATAEGLDPATPAVAIACATRPNQRAISAPISNLPTQIEQASLEGPVLVLVGQVCSEMNSFGSTELRKITHRM